MKRVVGKWQWRESTMELRHKSLWRSKLRLSSDGFALSNRTAVVTKQQKCTSSVTYLTLSFVPSCRSYSGVWAAEWAAYVSGVNKPTGSGKRCLSDKMRAL